MKLRQIEIFVEVMRTGSITKGAQILNISQPAVSKAIAYTEDQLGTKLFERMGGGLVPTPEAVCLFKEAEQVMLSLERFQDFSRDVSALKHTNLVIHSEHIMGLTFIPLAIERFREKYPDIRLEFEVHRPMRILNAVKSRQADLGFVHYPSQDNETEAELLRTGQIVCALRKDHPLADKNFITPDDLAQVPVVHCHGGIWLRKALEPLLFNRSNPIQPVIKVNDSVIGCTMAQMGLGVTLVNDLVEFGQGWPELIFIPFEPKIEINMGVIYRYHEPLSRQAVLFLDQVKRTIGELPGSGS